MINIYVLNIADNTRHYVKPLGVFDDENIAYQTLDFYTISDTKHHFNYKLEKYTVKKKNSAYIIRAKCLNGQGFNITLLMNIYNKNDIIPKCGGSGGKTHMAKFIMDANTVYKKNVPYQIELNNEINMSEIKFSDEFPKRI